MLNQSHENVENPSAGPHKPLQGNFPGAASTSTSTGYHQPHPGNPAVLLRGGSSRNETLLEALDHRAGEPLCHDLDRAGNGTYQDISSTSSLSICIYIYISQVKSAHHCVSRAVPKVWELSLVIKQILTDKAAGRCFAHRSFRKNTGQFKNLDFRISSGETWVPWLWSLIPHPKAGSENLRGSKHSFGRPRSRR